MISGVRKLPTTPYHPMGNGSVERFNRTLGCMICALSPAAKADWPRWLQTLMFMYNCTAHETTGYPPFYLMFGRVPHLPVDVLFHTVLHDSNVTSYDKYVASLTSDLREVLLIAQEHALKEQRRHAHLYNRKVKGSSTEVGDRVLLANKTEQGKKKLADKWESTIYTFVDMNAETHTYRIHDTVTDREKVVNRNLLLLVSFLTVERETDKPDLPLSMSAAGCSPPGTAEAGSASETLFKRVSGNGCGSG